MVQVQEAGTGGPGQAVVQDQLVLDHKSRPKSRGEKKRRKTVGNVNGITGLSGGDSHV